MLTDLHNNNLHTEDDLLDYAEYLGFGDLYIKVDNKTGLKSIIAVHSTKLGPAIGGTRCIPYPSTDAAIRDALRLARGMSYKAAICNLPHGGAKSVIIRPPNLDAAKRQQLFQKFGELVEHVKGQYIAAMDSGTEINDMDAIAKSTKYVTCTSDSIGDGDPSPHTALGVLRGIEATVKFRLGRDDLSGLHVAIQGVGHVGYYLAKFLHEKNVKLTVCDINPDATNRCVNEFGATVVSTNEIYSVPCDIFAPCALGGVINENTIPQLKTNMIVGSANNQLAKMSFDQVLFERDITYAPDFLVNAGGLIHVAGLYDFGEEKQAHEQIIKLYDETLNLFIRAEKENKPTNQIAIEIAKERLGE